MQRRTNRPRGLAIAYTVIGFVAFAALASLSVDYGRATLAKLELRQASLAAARAAATGLGSITTTQSLAVQYAGYNTCDGSPIVLDPTQDVEMGTWNPATKTFTTLTGAARTSANAVRVNCVRTAARGNAVPLLFASLVGKRSCDINNTRATVYLNGNTSSYGIVGLSSITLSGAASESFFSSSGVSGQSLGHIASNGNISLSGSSKINGSAFITSGHSASGGTITGGVKTLSSPLSYPNGSAGSYATTNDDANMGSYYTSGNKDFSIGSGKSLTLPGGHYYVHNFAMSGGSSVTFTGPATVYFYGTFNMSGSTTTKDSIPSNLNIVGVPTPTGGAPGSLTLSGSASLYASIYAPQSDVTLSGSGKLSGNIVGKKVTQSGSSTINVFSDLNLPGNGSLIQLVQ